MMSMEGNSQNKNLSKPTILPNNENKPKIMLSLDSTNDGDTTVDEHGGVRMDQHPTPYAWFVLFMIFSCRVLH